METRYLKVLLLRHGKSDWSAEFDHDHDRPLNSRGRRDAARMGRFLAEAGRIPDRVVSSTALRARDTVDRAVEAGAWDCPVERSRDLYETSPDEVLDLLRGLDGNGEVGSVLLAGHEPIWSSTVAYLTGGGRVRFPTAAVACIRFQEEGWADLQPGRGELLWFVIPKLLGK